MENLNTHKSEELQRTSNDNSQNGIENEIKPQTNKSISEKEMQKIRKMTNQQFLKFLCKGGSKEMRFLEAEVMQCFLKGVEHYMNNPMKNPKTKKGTMLIYNADFFNNRVKAIYNDCAIKY